MPKKQPYRANFTKLSPQLHEAIARMYKTGKFKTEDIARFHNVSTRQIQRIARNHGVIRTQADANRIAAPLKNYHTTPAELRVKRKCISSRVRYETLSQHPYCTLCGMRAEDGVRLEVDHIDNNPMNNGQDNLQVLCGSCNRGKDHVYRNFA